MQGPQAQLNGDREGQGGPHALGPGVRECEDKAKKPGSPGGAGSSEREKMRHLGHGGSRVQTSNSWQCRRTSRGGCEPEAGGLSFSGMEVVEAARGPPCVSRDPVKAGLRSFLPGPATSARYRRQGAHSVDTWVPNRPALHLPPQRSPVTAKGSHHELPAFTVRGIV